MHSFDCCPLRSSSLLIIDKAKQTIVTATDEVFDILGYKETTQLLNKPIEILRPRPYAKRANHFLFQHAETGKSVPFEVCRHQDPMSNAATTDLEYILMRPFVQCPPMNEKKTARRTKVGPVTVVRLSPFGMIEHACPSSEFPQSIYELVGQPIMSFIHPSDLRTLCQQLSKVPQQRLYVTHFRARWLVTGGCDIDVFDWVSLTVMNLLPRDTAVHESNNSVYPICIIRPIQHDMIQQQQNDALDYSGPLPFFISFVSVCLDSISCLLHQLWEQLGSTSQSSVIHMLCRSTVLTEELYSTLWQATTYVSEFLDHTASHLKSMLFELAECLAFLRVVEGDGNGKQPQKTKVRDSTVMNGSELHLLSPKENKRKNHDVCSINDTKSKTIKVLSDDSIWSVPLFKNNNDCLLSFCKSSIEVPLESTTKTLS
ncbi:MAG: hypothetical protein EXX96DRAFT_608625 [Benjaminiella poitrasii]|nr:MAG: hypothetical protein EXX96DRAFT_608625 [Benjaminiella poitrasii]